MPQTSPLLVFDLDGTLAETAGDLVATLNVILAREGLAPVALADARKMVGAGARALIQRGFEAGGRSIEGAALENLFKDFLTYYEAHIADESTLFDGVVAALDRFEAAGWDFAVCTNKVEHPSVRLLEALGIRNRFRAICGQDTFTVDGVAISKPDPRALLMTIEKARGVPNCAIMVGDSRTDIDTAKAAGIPVVAVDFGYTDMPVAHFGPDSVIGHFDELWDAVAQLKAFN
ncbi:MAG: HAD-superfamily hydrolase, subfamily variant 1 [Hyphomicrobiales bacterium]|nr:HAD-superfamily hydrolase, subfamily variant 1 [Hyphomicrobiales bacterium]